MRTGKYCFTKKALLIYQYLSLSGYPVLLQQSQEAYRVLEFLEMFLTHHPTQLNPTQPVGRPNPWTTLMALQIKNSQSDIILRTNEPRRHYSIYNCTVFKTERSTFTTICHAGQTQQPGLAQRLPETDSAKVST